MWRDVRSVPARNGGIRERAALARDDGQRLLLAFLAVVSVANATAQNRPTVSLLLAPDRPAIVEENGGVMTVTARLDRPASAPVSVTVAVDPAGSPSEPASRRDYTVSPNRVLTFAPGSTSSTGRITITAVDNDADGATHKRVRVAGVATTDNADSAGFREFLIRDDEDPPAAALVLTPGRIEENGGVSIVAATLEHPARGPVEFRVQVRLPPAGQGAGPDDYVLGPDDVLTIAQGSVASTGRVTIAAVDDDERNASVERVLYVRGYRQAGVTSALTTPWRALTIVDDEEAPPEQVRSGLRPGYRAGPDLPARRSAARFRAISWPGSSRSTRSTASSACSWRPRK